MLHDLIGIWRELLFDPDQSWVLFENGTCVILTKPTDQADIREDAVTLMREEGPVIPGTPAGDFSTYESPATVGWVVTSHRDDILTFVGPEELAKVEATALSVGLLGRSKRDRDAKELNVIHVECKRRDG